MAKLILEIETDDNATQMLAKLNRDVSAKYEAMQGVVQLLEGMDGGAYNGVMNVKVGGVQASTTGTFTGAPSNNETITVNGVAFTAKTSGATGNQFNIGGTVTITAANLVAAINASATAGILDVVLASSLAGVVTFTSKQAGKVGNAIQLSEALSNFTLAATVMSGGTQSSNVTYLYGKAATTAY